MASAVTRAALRVIRATAASAARSPRARRGHSSWRVRSPTPYRRPRSRAYTSRRSRSSPAHTGPRLRARSARLPPRLEKSPPDLRPTLGGCDGTRSLGVSRGRSAVRAGRAVVAGARPRRDVRKQRSPKLAVRARRHQERARPRPRPCSRRSRRSVDELSRGEDVSAGRPAASRALETARIAPVNADNPAISFVVDAKGTPTRPATTASASRSATAELFISAPIDPFLRGYASINGTTDEGFDVEEAALVTTALPYNLTVKGGRFFADFGRFPHWHDEALPFVDRPPSIERIIGGESQLRGRRDVVARADRPVHPAHRRQLQRAIGDQQDRASAQRSWSAAHLPGAPADLLRPRRRR